MFAQIASDKTLLFTLFAAVIMTAYALIVAYLGFDAITQLVTILQLTVKVGLNVAFDTITSLF